MDLIHRLRPMEGLFRVNIFYDLFAKKSCRYAPVNFIMAVHPSVCPQTNLKTTERVFIKWTDWRINKNKWYVTHVWITRPCERCVFYVSYAFNLMQFYLNYVFNFQSRVVAQYDIIVSRFSPEIFYKKWYRTIAQNCTCGVTIAFLQSQHLLDDRRKCVDSGIMRSHQGQTHYTYIRIRCFMLKIPFADVNTCLCCIVL